MTTTESQVRHPPYPSDTRAKGWRFELDYEQIEQSDTWSLAAEFPMAQHALLMMWMVAWRQVPCGSFPNDEAVIRAKCRITPAVWSKARDVLMRGWWLASDGLLYHDTLTMRAMEMMKRRRSDADRQAAKRSREAHAEGCETLIGVTGESRVTPTGVRGESSTDNRQPNTSTDVGDSSGVPKTNTPRTRARKRAAPAELVSVESLVSFGCEQVAAEDWLRIRHEKNLPLTRTAWEGVCSEAAAAGIPPGAAVTRAAREGWAGFKAKWLAEGASDGAVHGQAQRRPAGGISAADQAEQSRQKGERLRASMQAGAGFGPLSPAATTINPPLELAHDA